MNNKKLILVSTPRHIYLAIGLAYSDPGCGYHLIFIDQKITQNKNPLYCSMNKALGPFSSIEYLPIKAAGSKISHRKKVAAFLEVKIQALRPTEILTGNDRRFEFQYALNYARMQDYGVVQGGYIDDGTGSYIAVKDINRIKNMADRFIDTPLKKLVYGRWYQRSSPLGKSRWVDTRYLCHPQFTDETGVKPLNASDYLTKEVVDYLTLLMTDSGGDNIQFKSGRSLLVVLPHTSVMEDIYGSYERLVELVRLNAKGYESVYIKYHPREDNDPLQFGLDFELLNPKVPLEMYLSLITFSKVLGDVSSGLMACKWLYPESEVATFDIKSAYSESVDKFFVQLGINKLEVNNE